jgi:hypothetical protein
MVMSDVWAILQNIDPLAAVNVVMHKKAFESPSVMLFNNKRCTILTPEFVENTVNGLFDLKWAKRIGPLAPEWNHLVGYDAPNPKAKIVHFTKGVPCWPETRHSEWADEWRKELANLNSTVSFQELMGASVHVQS